MISKSSVIDAMYEKYLIVKCALVLNKLGDDFSHSFIQPISDLLGHHSYVLLCTSLGLKTAEVNSRSMRSAVRSILMGKIGF